MRIRKLSIKNLGKHKQLDAVLDGAVVGLMGANGSGKSTILKLIHFLLTGSTPTRETQESFIRKVDPELEVEPAFGSAEIEFSAQGDIYRLSRKIGNTSSRRLAKLDALGNEIKDDTYTGAAEIQTHLTEILGADKYAIDSAVFPEQGALDKIMFGAQSEREELLVRLLLLGHMQKVADVAAGKIKMLSSEIQDFSVLHDELQSSRNNSEIELGIVTSQLDKASNWDSEIAAHDKWLKINYEMESVGNSLRAAQNAVSENSIKLQELLSNKSAELKISIVTVLELQEWLVKLKNAYKNSRTLLTENEQRKYRYDKYSSLMDKSSKLDKEIYSAEALLPRPPDDAKANALQQKHAAQKQRVEWVNQLKVNKDKLETAQANISIYQKAYDAAGIDLNKANAEVVASNEKLGLCKTIVDTCKLVQHANCSSECPVCGSSLTGTDLAKRHVEYTNKYKELMTVHDILCKKHTDILKSASDANQAIVRSNNEIVNTTNAINDYESGIAATPEEDITKIVKDIWDDQQSRNVYYAAFGELKQLRNKAVEIQTDLYSFDSAERKTLSETDLTKLDADIVDLKAKLARWDGTLESINNTFEQCIRYEASITSSNTQVTNYGTKFAGLSSDMNNTYLSFSPRLVSTVNSFLTKEEVTTDLKQKNQNYTELKIKAQQLKNQTDSIKKRLLEIEQKIKLDEDKRAVITELQKVVTAFSRQGIPMAYVQHKFDGLVSMTQENLEIMDANFAIIPHPTKPVSLQFYRVDEPGQIVFDHDKLSGGQKVRLSIAFLLAVQQLVIPELGFLVLDEPSTHLDEEARENLKDLLLNLSQQLETTDTQIIVCDHARELEPAFVNTIQL